MRVEDSPPRPVSRRRAVFFLGARSRVASMFTLYFRFANDNGCYMGLHEEVWVLSLPPAF